jgi:hypothetical protein
MLQGCSWPAKGRVLISSCAKTRPSRFSAGRKGVRGSGTVLRRPKIRSRPTRGGAIGVRERLEAGTTGGFVRTSTDRASTERVAEKGDAASKSGGFSMVVVQKSAEPIATHHPTLATTGGLVRRDQPAAEPLMMPFPVCGCQPSTARKMVDTGPGDGWVTTVWLSPV